MDEKLLEKFTKYEIARIIGARGLQIAMDAPVLLKLSDDDLSALDFDALKIAEKELEENALPISVHRPVPRRGKDRLGKIKEEEVSDEELAKKEKEVEKEIAEDAESLGFSNPDESDDPVEEDSKDNQ